MTDKPTSDPTHHPSSSSGILTKADILEELSHRRLIKDGIPENVEGCSYDLRIGTIFREGRIIKGKQGAGDQVLLQPGEIISLFTLEELDLPANIAATAFPINALSSQGLLVLNPGHIDPGFNGPLTVRVINIRYTPKSIDLGTPIFTVIFERLPQPTNKYAKNVPREVAELRFNAADVEQNPKSLAKLVMLGKDKPLMTGEEVDRRIREHWMSRWALGASIIAAIFAVLAVVVTLVIEAYRANPRLDNANPAPVNVERSTPTPTLSPASEPSRQNKPR